MLIVNPVAGRRARQVGEQVLRSLESRQACLYRQTGSRGEATAFAREAAALGVRAVIVVGGDGTVNEVINGLAGSGVPLLIIPAGTTNVFAREMALPGDPLAALALLEQGRARAMSLGRINGRYFMLMAGIGFDAEVVSRVSLSLKRRLGRWAYVLVGLRALAGYKGHALRVIADGHCWSAVALVAGNARLYGGPFSITPRADTHDTLLDVCIFSGQGPLKMLKYVWEIMRGVHLRDPEVTYLRCTELEVEAKPSAYVQVDGELLGRTPCRIIVCPDAITIFLPQEQAKGGTAECA